jgi:hypothetical protein
MMKHFLNIRVKLKKINKICKEKKGLNFLFRIDNPPKSDQ